MPDNNATKVSNSRGHTANLEQCPIIGVVGRLANCVNRVFGSVSLRKWYVSTNTKTILMSTALTGYDTYQPRKMHKSNPGGTN